MLARGGVCILSNIRKWKKENKELLQKSKIFFTIILCHVVLQSGCVAVKMSRSKATCDEITDQPLHCTVWGSCDSHMTGTLAHNMDKATPLHVKKLRKIIILGIYFHYKRV